MNFDYIIVQAGGRGSRMDYLTRNKPKALVPVQNRPLLFHLFEKYPDKHFIIIGDYKFSVLEKYLAVFAGAYSYELINAAGHKGTCAGIAEAAARLPENSPFLLIWSDLILGSDFSADALPDADYVGLSGDFRCRWKYEDGVFAEEPSTERGVAGVFLFRSKAVTADVPAEGEFVRWLAGKELTPSVFTLHGTKEYGLISAYQKLRAPKCRPFNRIECRDGELIKTGIDAQGRALAVREAAWYRAVQQAGFRGIPQIKGYDPLVMEYIAGKNVYEYGDLPYAEKCRILGEIVGLLKELHQIGSCPFDAESYAEAYIGKTFDRLARIRDLVPFANDEWVTVNGKRCRNVFAHRAQITEMIDAYRPAQFVFLHGDCTFSNIMLRDETRTPVLIDPRGYFGKTELFGDPAYDWAKLWYSVAGNYDRFNRKEFSLEIGEDSVTLQIQPSGWEETEGELLRLIGEDVPEKQIRLIHAIIWLSLTTYAWEDYDSVCGAFYRGISLMEDLL